MQLLKTISLLSLSLTKVHLKNHRHLSAPSPASQPAVGWVSLTSREFGTQVSAPLPSSKLHHLLPLRGLPSLSPSELFYCGYQSHLHTTSM